MLRFATVLLTGALIGFGALVSVLSVTNLNSPKDRSELLSERIQQLRNASSTPKVQEQIEETEWQLLHLPSVQQSIYDRWIAMSKDWKSTSPETFTKTAMDLASIYMDNAGFMEALSVYDILLKYDKSLYGERSPEFARDLNNRGLCLYMIGTTLQTDTDRKYYFESAVNNVKASSEVWKQLGTEQSQFNIKNNDRIMEIATRDLADCK